MATLTDLHPAGTPELRDAAMKFIAKGDSAEGLRAAAADPRYVRDLARACGITPAEARGDLLAIAPAVEELEAGGLTPPDCRRLLGWSPELTRRVLAEAAAARARRAASGTQSAA
jgi:hypothetical protein